MGPNALSVFFVHLKFWKEDGQDVKSSASDKEGFKTLKDLNKLFKIMSATQFRQNNLHQCEQNMNTTNNLKMVMKQIFSDPMIENRVMQPGPPIPETEFKIHTIPRKLHSSFYSVVHRNPNYKNIRVIKLKFHPKTWTINQKEKPLTWSHFVSNIGGSLGIWTGSSIISLIHIATSICGWFFNKLCKKQANHQVNNDQHEMETGTNSIEAIQVEYNLQICSF